MIINNLYSVKINNQILFGKLPVPSILTPILFKQIVLHIQYIGYHIVNSL